MGGPPRARTVRNPIACRQSAALAAIPAVDLLAHRVPGCGVGKMAASSCGALRIGTGGPQPLLAYVARMKLPAGGRRWTNPVRDLRVTWRQQARPGSSY